MVATIESPPPARQPRTDLQVHTIRGQRHNFMLIPLIERHTQLFDGGLVSIGVEARALGDTPERMVRAPSIHVFDAGRNNEHIRFDVFRKLFHYYYVDNVGQRNTLWGYDPDANGPMIPLGVERAPPSSADAPAPGGQDGARRRSRRTGLGRVGAARGGAGRDGLACGVRRRRDAGARRARLDAAVEKLKP